jgi:hypothetical protein
MALLGSRVKSERHERHERLQNTVDDENWMSYAAAKSNVDDEIECPLDYR